MRGIGKGRDRDSRRETALGSPEQEGPIQARNIFANWAYPLIRLHSLNESNRLHSFSSHNCKADVKTSAQKKKGPTDFRVERFKSRRLGAFILSISTSDPLGM